ncbi:kappa-type opioid receptor-like [Ruditapes philippinarum]|uniref:kappa-type opioid receptor-like n=1 Tax=Ruditapes philippinarum TaxID=129788 RepID=UPI00295AE22F|nr:kappa-type opioid receptor-like [Ruditapes philippinarum]
MNATLLNQTWSNESETTLQNVTTTMDDVKPTKNSPMSSIDWEGEKKAMYNIEIILHCIFLVVGLVGNSLTIAVLIYKKWKNIASRHILIALAVSDTAMICSHTFNQDFLQDLFKLDVRAFSDIGCKIFYIFYRTSKMTSSWFIVFLCIERFVAVKFPLKVKIIITEMRIKVYIIVVYLTMTGFAIILSFSTATENMICKKDAMVSNEKQMFQALMLVEMLLYSVGPICLMSVLTPIIILQLYKRYQYKKTLTNNVQTETGKEREIQQLQELLRTTTVLISVVAAFIICVTPITVFQQVKFWLHIKKKEMERTYSIFVFRETSQRLEQINYSINFFLYILTSNTFRKTVLEMLHLKQNIERTSSKSQTQLTNIERAKAKRAALTSNTEDTCNEGDSICTESFCNQLVSRITTHPLNIDGTNCTEISENNTQTRAEISSNPKTLQKSGQENNQQENNHPETTCKETVSLSSTAQNNDHLLPPGTVKPTDTDIVDNNDKLDDNFYPICTHEQAVNNLPVQVGQLDSHESSLDSDFTDGK